PRGILDCYFNTVSDDVDEQKAVQGGVTCGFTDGHAKFIKAGDFLGKCPTKLEMVGVTGNFATGYTYMNDCHGMPNTTLNAGNLGIIRPNVNIQYPFWGLGS